LKERQHQREQYQQHWRRRAGRRRRTGRQARFLIPLALFIVLAGFLFVGLFLNPREVPSPFIGKPAPQFTLASCGAREDLLASRHERAGVAAQRLGIVVRRLPAGASAAGRDRSHEDDSDRRPQLQGQAGCRHQVAGKWGDPYALSVKDLDGRIGIEYGVYGVPETFVIDKEGVIRYKHIGPMTEESWRKRDPAAAAAARQDMKRLIAMLALLVLPFAVLATATPTEQDPVAAKRAVALAAQLRCLVCQNQSIAESDAELAVDLRRPDQRADQRRPQRSGDRWIHDRTLRRLRAVSAAVQRADAAALARACAAGAGGVDRFRPHIDGSPATRGRPPAD
jgi:cytochrome c biogenesis protein CcmG, thiol:disulfide interchange protein DsbE